MTERLKGSRYAGDSHPSKRRGLTVDAIGGNVIEVVEEFATEENRRELLLLERRTGLFSAGLVLVVFVE